MIKVSVVIAAYATPDEGLDRVISSLEAQTLPTDEFEAVFVDDGSPDDTLERLHRLAETRPWMRVFTIPNSGWGSAPRNEGTRQARGEYTLYMDHDDSLYPDALRAMWEFAHANGSDLVSPKESKTNDAWWGLNYTWWAAAPAHAGNVADVRSDHGIHAIVPMVPHKLYRRQLLLDHDITFPEGSRVLWEDQFFNIEAYRHARVVSIMADQPTYLWHASATNSSHTFDPSREDFWTMLAELLEFTDETLAGDDLTPERDFMRAQQVRLRVIDRTARLLVRDGATHEEREHAFANARRLLLKHSTPELERLLPQKHRVQAALLRADRADLFALHHRSDLARTARLKATGVRWSGSSAVVSVQFRWLSRDGATEVFRTEGGRIYAGVPAPLTEAVEAREWDVTDDVRDVDLRIVARDRNNFVSWELPLTVENVGYREVEGVGEIYGEATATLDFSDAQLGAPLTPGVWDLRWSLIMGGMERIGGVTYDLPERSAALSGVAATAYGNGKHELTIDTSGRLRTVAIDARPRAGRVDDGDRLVVPLRRLVVTGVTDRPADVYAGPHDGPDNLPLADGVDLGARLVADADGARIEGDATALTEGRYALYSLRRGALRRTKYRLAVGDDGVVLS